MKKDLLIGLGVVAVVVLLLIVSIISQNNRLVALQENVHSAWGQVETVLQRRYDLIPNLVNTVKGYAKHEKDVFEDVTRLRSQWASAGTRRREGEGGRPIGGRPGPTAAGGRAISRLEGQQELPRPAVRVGGHREPHHRGTATLQRGGPRL